MILLVLVYRVLRRPPNPKRTADAIEKVGKVASSPAVAILGAGAALANPGAFIPIALKNISELDPSATQYIVDWLFFSLVSLLPLLVAIVLLLVARDWATRLLGVGARVARAQRADRGGRDRRPPGRLPAAKRHRGPDGLGQRDLLRALELLLAEDAGVTEPCVPNIVPTG